MTKLLLCAAAAAITGFLSAAGAQAQNAPVELVEILKSENWSVYRSIVGHPECGVISLPSESVNRREGKIVDVRRGDILLSVTILPTGRYRQLLSFQAGYPFKRGSKVTLRIGSREFTLDPGTEGDLREWAWPAPGNDKEIIDAMKKGRDAVISAVSTRDTRTTDTFSLIGVTAALVAAEECAGQL